MSASSTLLRAYNAEADNMVRGMKPYKLDSAVDRLNKVVNTIQNLGKTMSIQVTPEYHRLRIRELELAADYQEMLAREKEKEREERERLREQRKVEQEIAREKERLEKERQHYANANQALLDKATPRVPSGCAPSSSTWRRLSPTLTTGLQMRARATST